MTINSRALYFNTPVEEQVIILEEAKEDSLVELFENIAKGSVPPVKVIKIQACYISNPQRVMQALIQMVQANTSLQVLKLEKFITPEDKTDHAIEDSQTEQFIKAMKANFHLRKVLIGKYQIISGKIAAYLQQNQLISDIQKCREKKDSIPAFFKSLDAMHPGLFGRQWDKGIVTHLEIVKELLDVVEKQKSIGEDNHEEKLEPPEEMKAEMLEENEMQFLEDIVIKTLKKIGEKIEYYFKPIFDHVLKIRSIAPIESIPWSFLIKKLAIKNMAQDRIIFETPENLILKIFFNTFNQETLKTAKEKLLYAEILYLAKKSRKDLHRHLLSVATLAEKEVQESKPTKGSFDELKVIILTANNLLQSAFPYLFPRVDKSQNETPPHYARYYARYNTAAATAQNFFVQRIKTIVPTLEQKKEKYLPASSSLDSLDEESPKIRITPERQKEANPGFQSILENEKIKPIEEEVFIFENPANYQHRVFGDPKRISGISLTHRINGQWTRVEDATYFDFNPTHVLIENPIYALEDTVNQIKNDLVNYKKLWFVAKDRQISVDHLLVNLQKLDQSFELVKQADGQESSAPIKLFKAHGELIDKLIESIQITAKNARDTDIEINSARCCFFRKPDESRYRSVLLKASQKLQNCREKLDRDLDDFHYRPERSILAR